MTEPYHFSVAINLAGLTARIQRLLQASMSLVAIGLNARKEISEQDLKLPDAPVQHEYSASNRWNAEQAGEAWQTWILRNGFRDVAEAINGLLEETQLVLAHWRVATLQKERQLRGSDWNDIVVKRISQFHRLGLPDKIEFLEKEYGLGLPAALTKQVLTINVARNCLVHRGGVVTEREAGDSKCFTMEWKALVVVLVEEGIEKEIEPPHRVEAGAHVGAAIRDRSKAISVGQQITVNVTEYSQICWTLLMFAAECAKALEAHGKAQGISFTSKTVSE